MSISSRADRERESRRLTLGRRLNTKLTKRSRRPWDGSTVPSGASFHDIAPGDPERLRVWAVTDDDNHLILYWDSDEPVTVVKRGGQ